jgi:hypothetical protein
MLSKNEYQENLRRISGASSFYKEASEEDRERIYTACQSLFDMVDAVYLGDDDDSVYDSGLDSSFGVLLLLFGAEFLERQFACKDIQEFMDKYLK